MIGACFHSSRLNLETAVPHNNLSYSSSPTWFIEVLKSVGPFIFWDEGIMIFPSDNDHHVFTCTWNRVGWSGSALAFNKAICYPKRVVKRTQYDSFSWNVCQVCDALKSMGWIAHNAWSVQEVKANSLGSCMDCAGRSERPCSSFAHVS